MNYIELYIPTPDSVTSEIYMAELSDFPFESFEQEELSLKGYIKKDLLEECRAELDSFLHTTGVQCSFTEIESVNWNAMWESNFEAVDVEGRCLIRAPFHEPSTTGAIEVVIMPKMSFGTGHHATTWLMSKQIMTHQFTDMSGLDMGSGTGILSILAAKLGAEHIDAVDIDEWAAENCGENIEMNGVAGCITPILGDVSAIVDRKYDFILANINRNILLADMKHYIETLNAKGFIIFSGILEQDIDSISDCATNLGLSHVSTILKDGWAAIEFSR